MTRVVMTRVVTQSRPWQFKVSLAATATAVAQVHEVIYYYLLLCYYCYCRGTSARGDLLLFIIILLLLLPWHKCTI